MICSRLLIFLTAAVTAAAQSSTRLQDVQPAISAVEPEASQYVAALGSRLAYAAPYQSGVRYHFVLYDDSVGLSVANFGVLQATAQVNVLPNGIVLVPTRLFRVAADESEFASALARGVAHIFLDHPARFYHSRPLFKPIPPSEPAPQSARTFQFSRSFEKEADQTAVAILVGASVNPEALLRYAGNNQASLDTSPERLEPIAVAISQLPPRTYAPSNSLQFEAIKSRISAGARVGL